MVLVICGACWLMGWCVAKIPEFTTPDTFDDWER